MKNIKPNRIGGLVLLIIIIVVSIYYYFREPKAMDMPTLTPPEIDVPLSMKYDLTDKDIRKWE